MDELLRKQAVLLLQCPPLVKEQVQPEESSDLGTQAGACRGVCCGGPGPVDGTGAGPMNHCRQGAFGIRTDGRSHARSVASGRS